MRSLKRVCVLLALCGLTARAGTILPFENMGQVVGAGPGYQPLFLTTMGLGVPVWTNAIPGNSLNWPTNYYVLAGTTITLNNGFQLLTTNASFTVAGVSNATAGYVASTVLIISNSSGSSITITMPAGVHPKNSVFTVTNGQLGQLSIYAYDLLFTNCSYTPLP